jgi:hypothetical protein
MDFIFMMVGRLILPILAIGCSSCAECRDVSSKQAIDIARSYVTQVPPFSRSEIDLNNFRLTESSMEYVISFSPKKGFLGGAPSIYVTKCEGRVSKVSGAQ